MRTRYLLGLIAVLLLVLAIWLVPMALAAVGGSTASPGQDGLSQAETPGSQCPFLQTHPWLDPHGSGATGSPGETGGASTQVIYY